MKYIAPLFLLFILAMACGSGEKTSPTNKKSTAPKPVEKVTAAKVESSSSASEEKGTQDSQSEPVPKEQLDKAKKILKKVKDGEVAEVNAKKLFKIHCAVCHGFTGNMMINGAKDLTKSKISIEEAVAQVYFGKGLMTPYKGVLKDAEIVAVSKYVESEFRK